MRRGGEGGFGAAMTALYLFAPATATLLLDSSSSSIILLFHIFFFFFAFFFPPSLRISVNRAPAPLLSAPLAAPERRRNSSDLPSVGEEDRRRLPSSSSQSPSSSPSSLSWLGEARLAIAGMLFLADRRALRVGALFNPL